MSMGDRLQSSPYLVGMVVVLIFLSCYLLVAELPLFALKFKHWGWKGNEVKYIYILSSAAMIVLSLVLGLGVIGIAAAIAWYVLLSAATCKKS